MPQKIHKNSRKIYYIYSVLVLSMSRPLWDYYIAQVDQRSFPSRFFGCLFESDYVD